MGPTPRTAGELQDQLARSVRPAAPRAPYLPGGKPLRMMIFTVFPPRDHGRRAPKPIVVRVRCVKGTSFTEAQEIEQLSKITDAIEQQYPSHEWRMTRIRRDEWNFTAGELKPLRPMHEITGFRETRPVQEVGT